MMKKLNRSVVKVTLLLLVSLLFSWPCLSRAAGMVHLDILYMNHGPMRPTIAKIKDLLGNYGGKVQSSWHDIDQPSGKFYMEEQKITGHIPLLIKIDGQSDFNIDGRDVKLQGFPTGASPFKRVEGNWSFNDLQLLLDNLVR